MNNKIKAFLFNLHISHKLKLRLNFRITYISNMHTVHYTVYKIKSICDMKRIYILF